MNILFKILQHMEINVYVQISSQYQKVLARNDLSLFNCCGQKAYLTVNQILLQNTFGHYQCCCMYL